MRSQSDATTKLKESPREAKSEQKHESKMTYVILLHMVRKLTQVAGTGTKHVPKRSQSGAKMPQQGSQKKPQAKPNRQNNMSRK